MIHEGDVVSTMVAAQDNKAVARRLEQLDPKTKIDLVEEIRLLTLEKQRAVRAANDMKRSLTHERRIKRKLQRDMSQAKSDKAVLVKEMDALREERKKERALLVRLRNASRAREEERSCELERGAFPPFSCSVPLFPALFCSVPSFFFSSLLCSALLCCFPLCPALHVWGWVEW